jgi:hypothetical protein
MRRLKSVRKYSVPDYPLRAQALSDPRLLAKLPDRWQRCKMAAATAGLLASVSLSLSSCVPKVVSYAGVPLPPDSLSEADALNVIKNAAGDIFTGMQQPYRVSESLKTIVYVYYDVSAKTLEEVNLKAGSDGLEVDAFNQDKGIGFEYIEKENDSASEPTGFIQTGHMVDQADKEGAYVLVLPAAYDDNQQENSMIKEQIDAFISWLKAEGII